eukprot:Skav227834  [mRNA]  locus=scaffold948:455653:459617:+ [translate_table: standard]
MLYVMLRHATSFYVMLRYATSCYVMLRQGVWVQDPLVADDLAMLFDAFGPDLETELQTLGRGLKEAFKTASLQEMAIILEAMATARLTYDEAYKAWEWKQHSIICKSPRGFDPIEILDPFFRWQVVGEIGSLHCANAPEDEVAEFGFAVALAAQRISKQCYLLFKEGLEVNLRALPGERVRLLAWATSEAGATLSDLFGEPPGKVDPELAEHVWTTCSSLEAKPSSQLVSGWPLPIVEVEKLLLEEEQSLVDLANDNDLWRPSARKGGTGDDAGRPVEGFPWTALLASPSHRSNPTAEALRQWVATSFQAPLAHVEAVRLIRYRPGEAPKTPRSDLRPAEDSSLWLSGQRLVTVMLQLNDIGAHDGGETFFPNLQEGEGSEGMKIGLQAGSALVWPTVGRDGSPTDLTQRMALPTEGTKYVALTWLRVGPAPGETGGAPA